MKILLGILLSLFALNSYATSSSLYTYDCVIKEENNFFAKEFHLTQEFEEGILVNKSLRILQTGRVEGERKYDTLLIYKTPGQEIHLSWSLSNGTASGDAYVVNGGQSAEYFCSADWSPY